MPVHHRTHMFIKEVPTRVLTILTASSLSLPFYLKETKSATMNFFSIFIVFLNHL